MKDKLLSFECEKQQVKYDIREENFFMLTSILAPELDEDAGDTRQPIDLVCVIDRSGSMAGSRMKLTKQALDFLVQEMTEKDRISIILFDNDVDIFYPLTECTSENKVEIRKEIENISARGSTNLSGGLFTGLEQLRTRTTKNQISSVLLFTDGEANEGLQDSKSIIDMIQGTITHPPLHVREGKKKESLLQTYLRRKKAKKKGPKQPMPKPSPSMPNNPNLPPVVPPFVPMVPLQPQPNVPMVPPQPVPQPMPPVLMSRTQMMPSRTEMISRPPPVKAKKITPSRTQMAMPPMHSRTEMISRPIKPKKIAPSRTQMAMPPMQTRTEMMVNPNPPMPPANIFSRSQMAAPPQQFFKPPPQKQRVVVDRSHLGPGYNYLADGISLYTFGFGNSHNEKLLKDLADASSGIYYFIKTTEDIAESFVDCLGGLLSVVCKDLRVEFHPLNGVQIKKVHTVYKQETLPNGGVAVLLPDLQSEEKRDLLVTCTLPNLSDPELRWKSIRVKLTYKNKEKEVKEEELMGIIMRVSEEPEKQEVTNEKISEQKNRVYVTEVMDDVRKLADARKFDEAKKRCQEAMKTVEQSAAGQNTFCQALVKDLGSQMSGLNQSSYIGRGYRKKMFCMQQGLQRQRVADLQSSSNMLFANKKRGALKSKFRRGKY